MKTSPSRLGAVLAVLVGTSMVHAAATDPPAITYTGDGSDLQEVIDAAPTGVTITFDAARCLEITKSITVRRSLALSGLNARLPQKLGRTPILIVAAEGVTLSGLELQGNYDSVSQDDRAPLIHVTKGRFKAKRCVFRDASKDGIMVEFTAADCKQPVKISNTTNVVIEDLTITNRTKADSARVRLANCHGVRLGDIRIRGLAQGVEPIVAKNCTDVTIGPLTRSDE